MIEEVWERCKTEYDAWCCHAYTKLAEITIAWQKRKRSLITLLLLIIYFVLLHSRFLPELQHPYSWFICSRQGGLPVYGVDRSGRHIVTFNESKCRPEATKLISVVHHLKRFFFFFFPKLLFFILIFLFDLSLSSDIHSFTPTFLTWLCCCRLDANTLFEAQTRHLTYYSQKKMKYNFFMQAYLWYW